MGEPIQLAQVVSARPLTSRVRELVLEPLERRISFKPGQWVSLKLPVGTHPPLNRAYTMAEPEQPSGRLTLVYDLVPGGLGSHYLATLKTGDRIPLSGPYGNFVLPDPSTKELLFIARYSGIVPFRCMLTHFFLSSHPLHHRVTLLYSAPDREDMVYHDEFAALASRQAHFRYLPVVLPHNSPPEAEIEAMIERLKPILADGQQTVPMICGIKAFVRPLRTFFTELGFDRREVRVETYD
ncbi:MAG TPA: FAD-dependent oxidoreductase [Nitrospiraceae bacterium]|nr:FAD-dependent oxidoreductase [Nitrospiraceae bacterium]